MSHSAVQQVRADTAKLQTVVRIAVALAWRWTAAVARAALTDSTP
jgi:hypothetical protein